MTLREKILADVQELPEAVLLDLQNAIEKIKEKEAQPSLMSELRKIKIKDLPPDFSRNIDLYLNGEKKID